MPITINRTPSAATWVAVPRVYKPDPKRHPAIEVDVVDADDIQLQLADMRVSEILAIREEVRQEIARPEFVEVDIFAEPRGDDEDAPRVAETQRRPTETVRQDRLNSISSVRVFVRSVQRWRGFVDADGEAIECDADARRYIAEDYPTIASWVSHALMSRAVKRAAEIREDATAAEQFCDAGGGACARE